MWSFWWYRKDNQVPWDDKDNKSPWREWYDMRDMATKAKHDDVFRFLEANVDWRQPHAKKIKNGDGLVEVTIKGKVQHRLIGFTWPKEKGNFTFLVACTHKGSVYDPKDCFETAARRMKEIQTGSAWIGRCDRPK